MQQWRQAARNGNHPALEAYAAYKLLIAENLRDCLWAVELLAAHDAVDANRLGCVGLSYGGRMTMLTAAVEPRIKVAVVSGALNGFQERIGKPYSCGAQIIPGLLKYGDVPEIGSLIAPRPCLWEVGTRDGLINPKWADEALVRRRIDEAIAFRERLAIDATAYRLIHGEADLLPSLIVDRYGDYLVVQALSQGMDRLMPALTTMLGEGRSMRFQSVRKRSLTSPCSVVPASPAPRADSSAPSSAQSRQLSPVSRGAGCGVTGTGRFTRSGAGLP